MPTKKDSGTSGTEGDGGQAEVQAAFDAEQEQGFRGVRADPTPLDNYTLPGVTSDAPTPETDPALIKDTELVYGGPDGQTVIGSDKPGDAPDGGAA